MKKYIWGGVLALLILPLFSNATSLPAEEDIDPNPGTSSCVSISNNLRYQSRDVNTNGEVSTLQDFLQSKGYLNSEPTGYFGLLTTKAVKDLQSANGISPTGYVGPLTRAKISTMSCGSTSETYPTPSITYPTPTPYTYQYPTPAPVGKYPPGCWSNQGYSPTTGQPCGIVYQTPTPIGKYPPGCTSYQGYSTTTGLPCSGSSNSLSPVISGVSGPQSLNINQQGTWTVKASSPNGGNLSYGVNWGDEVDKVTPYQFSAKREQQSATFSHSYSQAGIYNPVFTVTNNNAPGGEDAQTSLSVNVGAVPTVTPYITASLVRTTTEKIYTAQNPGEGDKETYIIDFDITANKDVYISNGLTLAKDSGPAFSEYSVNPDDGKTKGVALITSSASHNEDTTSLFAIPEGHTRRFTANITLEKTVSAGSVAVILKSISYRPNSPSSNYQRQILGPSFKTNSIYLNYIQPVAQSSITVLSPNGGNNFEKNKTYKISWKSSGVSTFDIWLDQRMENGAPGDYVIVSGVSGTSYQWTVPSTATSIDQDAYAGQYKIMLCNSQKDQYGDSLGCDESDDWFNVISSASTQPSINLLSPNGGEAFMVGQEMLIKWDLSNIQNSEKVYLELRPTSPYVSPVTKIAITSSPSMSYRWVVPEHIIPGQYIIEIYKYNDESLKDISDAPFSIVGSGSSQPSITVLSPNGGEIWKKGTTETIKWRDSGSVTCLGTGCTAPTYEINLDKYPPPCTTNNTCPQGGYAPSNIAHGVQGSSYKWSVGYIDEQRSFVPDGLYKVSVCQSGTSICDSGDDYFKIISSSVGTFQSIGLQNQTAGAITSGSTMNINIPTPGAGQALILTYGATPNTATISSVSGGGVTWVKAKSSNTQKDAEIWYGLNSSGSGSTVTVNLNGPVSGSGGLANVSTWTGLASSSVVDASGSNSGTTDAVTTATINTTNGNDLIIAMNRSATANPSAPTNSFELMSSPNSSAFQAAYRIVSSTGSYSTGWTMSGSNGWESEVVAFKGNSNVLGAKTFYFTQSLSRGSYGTEVMELQKFLNTAGYYFGVINGNFGFTTEAAVVKFELANGLTVDGIVGPTVRALLNK